MDCGLEKRSAGRLPFIASAVISSRPAAIRRIAYRTRRWRS